ncbi:Uncharacterized protein PBTT_04412 [Plasmodiophora brassicae]
MQGLHLLQHALVRRRLRLGHGQGRRQRPGHVDRVDADESEMVPTAVREDDQALDEMACSQEVNVSSPVMIAVLYVWLQSFRRISARVFLDPPATWGEID